MKLRISKAFLSVLFLSVTGKYLLKGFSVFILQIIIRFNNYYFAALQNFALLLCLIVNLKLSLHCNHVFIIFHTFFDSIRKFKH